MAPNLTVPNEGRDEPETCRDGGACPVSLDDLLAALAHRHRRAVLYAFARAGRTELHLEEVRDLVAADPAVDTPTALAFHHCHLPSLSRHGLVDYDADSHVVTYRPTPTVERYVATTARDDGVALADAVEDR